jgi:CheY-like chemotaxis protein
MPELDGIETTKLLRELGYDKPIVALSANAVAGQAEVFHENGFNDFISKPIDVRRLNAVLNKFVRDSQKRQVEAVEVSEQPQSEGSEQSQSASLLKDRQVAGIDITQGMKKFGGDEGIYLKILRSYTASMRVIIDELEVAARGRISESTCDDYRRNVHSIKGTSYDVYADEIGAAAERLENAAKSGEFDYINAENADFFKAVQEFVARLESLLAELDSANPKPKKSKPDSAILAKLLESCKTYDMTGADSAMEQLEEFDYESDDGLVEWLREKSDLMKYDEIAEKLS